MLPDTGPVKIANIHEIGGEEFETDRGLTDNEPTQENLWL